MSTPPRSPRIVIVGAGMSGLLMGMRLVADGIESFTILERAETVGGTWRDNTYPGLICDVPADLYSYVGRPNAEWNHRFARGPEIQRYLERTAAEAGLGRFIRLGTEVVGAAFRDGLWQVETAAGETMVAEILIAACGFLRQPRYPAIAGLDSFAGAMFHSARWDHRVALAGARVGIIGTGSTGVQIVPAIVETVGTLSLFQRTAPWLLPFPDHEYRSFEKALTRRIPALSGIAHRAFGLMFEWTFARAVIGNRLLQGAFQRLCQYNLDRNVKDPDLRARLQPDYRAGCKRLMFSSAFYPAIQRPNAELVDAPIERVTPAGIETADGREHRLDILILATGFDAHAYMQPMRVAGVGGRTIAEAWREGVHAYRTVAMPGFPNFFMLVGPGSPVGNFSIIPIAEIQADYILQAVRRIAAGEIATLQPTQAATARFNQAFRRATEGTVWLTGCRNWYLDRNGVPDVWPWTIARFRAELRRPHLADYAVTSGDAAVGVANVGVAASWQSRIVQAIMRRLIAPRLSLAHGVAPFRRTLGLLAALPPCPTPRGFVRSPATLGGVPGEWLRRRDRHPADAPVLLHFHGGGFVAGTSRLGRRIVARIAARTGSDAFSVDYRLAPEDPFPAALDDAVACYRATVADGVVPGRIVLAGESAGAALALGLAIRIATDGSPGPGPAALVLLSPWLDLTLTGASLAAGDDPGLRLDLLVAARRLYEPDERYVDPLASPLFGPLAGLPPTLIQVGTREILLDDARRLAIRLGEAGVERRLEEWAGMHHAWHLAPGVVPEVGGAFDAIARFIAGR